MHSNSRATGIRLASFLIAGTALCALPSAAQPPGDLQLVQVGGQTFTRPVAARSAGDGSNRLFVVEQAGVIRIIDLGTNATLPTPFLDIQTLVDDAGNEQGLLGLAFHPDYATNGLFYVNYTRDPGPGLDRTTIARYQVSAANPNLANTGSATTIIEIPQDFSNHNGGDIHFGRDGYLYIGMGDGGSGGDPNNRSQNLGQLLGKMLRIDVDNTTPGGATDYCGINPNNAYRVPGDNPFAGGSGDCDEIWALGVRNPFRFSFDRVTGDMWIGDVGQGPTNAREEIDFQPFSSNGGENYGWSCMEGFQTPNFNPCIAGPLTPPVHDYPHSQGSAVTGGFRYRGSISAMYGLYWFSDSGSGRLWYAQETGPGTFAVTQWQDTPRSIVGFGEDDQGELYVMDLFPGRIDRFESPSSSLIFTDGFESGDTAAWSATIP